MSIDENIKIAITYDPEAGKLFWNNSVGGSSKQGKEITSKHKRSGYVLVTFKGKQYPAHRVAWFLYTGKWPDNLIDHINGDPGDNRIVNLREATYKQNSQNQKKATKQNTHGNFGVSMVKDGRLKCWSARIRVDGVLKFLGYYYTSEEAKQAYITAKRNLHEYCTI